MTVKQQEMFLFFQHPEFSRKLSYTKKNSKAHLRVTLHAPSGEQTVSSQVSNGSTRQRQLADI